MRTFPLAGVQQFVAGPDGAEWFVTGAAVGRITATGDQTIFPLPSNAVPQGIAAGPDGALWFTESSRDKIGRITTSGQITEYALAQKSDPVSITNGPDGALWFTECAASKVGRITVQGAITEYAAPGCPYGITSGPDGNLWFLNENAVNRISTRGVLVPSYFGSFDGIVSNMTLGPDGNMWVASSNLQPSVWKITSSGQTARFPLQLDNATLGQASAVGIATGSDGRLWFTEPDGYRVGALSLPALAAAMNPAYPVAGKSFQLIASGADSQTANLSEIRVGVDWGDGTTSDMSLSGSSNVFFGGADHTYAKEGNYLVRLTVRDSRNGLEVSTQERLPVARTQLGELGMLEFPVDHNPLALTNGPDGAIWFTADDAIGRITIDGKSSTMAQIDRKASPMEITNGPDGALWFTEYAAEKVVRISTQGATTEFSLPQYSYPQAIATGPDGNLWFTEGANVGRLSRDGGLRHFYVDWAGVSGITAGPDGSMWAAGSYGKLTARITMQGDVSTFPTGQSTLVCAGLCSAITNGPDGALWFTLAGSLPTIGRVTTSGQTKLFSIDPVGASSITTGSDGNLWYTDSQTKRVSRLTTDGVVTNLQLPNSNAAPSGIISGPDGNIWFAERGAAAIGKIVLHIPRASGKDLSIFRGQEVSAAVSIITDEETISPNSFSATIDWGDGTFSPASLSGASPTFAVNGTHTYAKEGDYKIGVSLQEPANHYSFSTSASAHVDDFTFDLAPNSSSSATIQSGQSASYNLLVTPLGTGLFDQVSFSCAGLPTATSCSFNPVSGVPGKSPLVATLTIRTGTSLSTALSMRGILAVGLFLPAVGMVFVTGSSRMRRRVVLGTIAFTVAISFSACGGTSSHPQTNPGETVSQHPSTPPSVSTITVTATATKPSGASLQHSTKVTLVVQ